MGVLAISSELFESAVVSFEDALLALGCGKSTVMPAAAPSASDSKNGSDDDDESKGESAAADDPAAKLRDQASATGATPPEAVGDTPARPRRTRHRRRGSVVALSHVQRQAEVDCRTSLANSLYRLGLLEPHGAHSAHTQALFQRCEALSALVAACTMH